MKRVNWDNSRIRNLVDHETPFMVIDCPGRISVRLWWTASGAYGRQVLTVIYGPGEDLPVYEITDGCGYNKMADAIENAFYHLGHGPRGYKSGRGESALRPFHVGGNYYRIQRKHWLRIK